MTVHITDRSCVPTLHGRPGPAGLDAGLHPEDTINRAAACFFASAAFNLSDDLSDDDCEYLPPAPAQAVVLILHSLFVAGPS